MMEMIDKITWFLLSPWMFLVLVVEVALIITAEWWRFRRLEKKCPDH